MALKITKSISNILDEAASIAKTGGVYVKQAAAPKDPEFVSDEAKEMLKVAKLLKSKALIGMLKKEAATKIAKDVFPSRESLRSEEKTQKIASSGDSSTDLKMAAAAVRKLASAMEKRAHVSAYKCLMGAVAADKLASFLE
jgi:hypothetical protein